MDENPYISPRSGTRLPLINRVLRWACWFAFVMAVVVFLGDFSTTWMFGQDWYDVSWSVPVVGCLCIAAAEAIAKDKGVMAIAIVFFAAVLLIVDVFRFGR